MGLADNFPQITGVRWFNVAVLTLTPAIAVYGMICVPLQRKTLIFSVLYYIFSMLGITAGYHRLWSHRSYTASPLLQFFLLMGGTSAVQGSCYWWSRAHRSHHRYTDTDQDPYNTHRGLLWTHVGWMLFTTRLRSGRSEAGDLKADTLLRWQHEWYLVLAPLAGFLVPALVPAVCWGDWRGGVCYAAAARLTVAHHSTFSINSVAHWLGSAPYDDLLSPRDHFLSALLTMGEGYHNFHHQFPMDYRNAFHWYQYDPTKWFIALCACAGLAANLRRFPRNEVRKGMLGMELKRMKSVQDSIVWPKAAGEEMEIGVVDWEGFQKHSQSRVLILVSGYIHDVTQFVDEHPGGRSLMLANSGKDTTAAFFGSIYRHSNAAHNLLAMMRVGILQGGVETVRSDQHQRCEAPTLAPVPILALRKQLYITELPEGFMPSRRPPGL